MTDPTPSIVTVSGAGLNIESLHAVAYGCKVRIEPDALSRMSDSNALIVDAARTGKPVYGVTTGLGPQVTTVLSEEMINQFALKTVRGRAHALGAPLAKPLVRASMTVRLNSLLIGASGASPAVANHLLACLNADLVPYVGETASVGAADLLWGGSMGLALIGEGRFLDCDKPSADALADAGIAALKLGPRDGLALASHSSFSAAIAAIGHHRCTTLWNNTQLATALTLEGFRGNLSPLNPDVLATNVQPGQSQSADDIRKLLKGSALFEEGAARRLQDPLSMRNAVQVNGAVFASLEALADALTAEINGASDNPIVLTEKQEVLSGGGYLNPYLGSLLVALNHSLVQMAALSVSRTARMMSNRFTDLPIGLHQGETGSVGLGAITKVTESLFGEIVQLAAPPPIYPPTQADCVEDCITNTSISAKSLLLIVDKLNLIIAVEMIAAVHAIYLAKVQSDAAPGLRKVIEQIREISPALSEDRSLTMEIELLATVLSGDDFSFVRTIV